MGRPRYMKIGTNAVHGMHTGPMQMKGMVDAVERVRHELFGGRIRDGHPRPALLSIHRPSLHPFAVRLAPSEGR
eukprot:scaffold55143_cov55-Phaeocystis_antarctica.AAC.2